MLDERLDAAERLCARKDLTGLEEAPSSLEITAQVEANHAAKAALLGLGEFVLGMTGKTRVDDLLDLLMAF